MKHGWEGRVLVERNLKEGENLEDLGVDERLLKFILKKCDEKLLPGSGSE
jgi:hypothetical protein